MSGYLNEVVRERNPDAPRYCRQPAPQLLAADRFDADGRLTDDGTRKFLGEFLAALDSFVRANLRQPAL